MDSAERKQVRLLLEHLGSEYDRACSNAQEAMHADYAARGLLQSGATVKQAISIAEAHSNSFLDKLIDQVRQLPKIWTHSI